MITVAGALVGIALVRLAGQREAWLRAALLAQVADLVTFAAVWEHSQGELNPIGALVHDAAVRGLGEESGAAVAIAAAVLFGLKLGLLAFLARVDAHLGRYRRLVLAVATGAGALGAASNLVAHPNAAGVLLVVAAFALVAIRWPARFRDALGLAVRLSAAVLLAIGGLAAVSYLQSLREGYGCDVFACPSTLEPMLEALAIAFFVAALLALLLAIRFCVRFLPPRLVHAR